jgi:sensor domain CHASE-containing protein
MKLRQKTLLLVVMIYTPLVVLVSLAVRGVVLRGHLLIEQQQVSRNARRLLNTFSYELDQLEKFVRDWASWDDTREFVRGLFPEYEEANLMDETFLNSNLGYFVLLDTDWNVIYEGHYDEEAKAFT